MRRAALLVQLLGVVAACSGPPPGQVDPTAFRGATWGMTSVQVRAGEKSNQLMSLTETEAVYADRVLGLIVLVRYSFDEGSLVGGGYTVREPHEQFQRYIGDYETFRSALTEEYGRPEDRTLWFNPLYEGDYVRWGQALAQGHVLFSSFWATQDTEITLSLGGEGRAIEVLVDYASKGFADVLEQRRRKALREKL